MKQNLLFDLLQLQRLTEVVDIGANPIDGSPPYRPMLDAGLCRVTGFEPQEEALAALQKAKGPLERYLPWAVGDGQTHTLNICQASGMTSIFEPDPAVLAVFEMFQSFAKVQRRVEVPTRRLDDLSDIERIDYLKIDIQGGELAVFQHGRQRLADAVVIQTEMPFVCLYKNQPTFGEIDTELRQQGFVPHCLTAVKQWIISPCVINGDPRRPLNQLLETDVVYVRDFTKPELMSAEQLKHLAMVAHHCYSSFDLSLRCILLLEGRGELPVGSQARYLAGLAQRG